MDRTNETQRRGSTNDGDNVDQIINGIEAVTLAQHRPLDSEQSNAVIASGSASSSTNNATYTFLDHGDWMNMDYDDERFEMELYEAFQDSTLITKFRDPNDKTKEKPQTGTNENKRQSKEDKTFFNYILLYSSVTADLPCREKDPSESMLWSTFQKSIFYIGRGTDRRLFGHFTRAAHMYDGNEPTHIETVEEEIAEIWKKDEGVIPLCIFANTTEIEACTREALMIDALGKNALVNCARGSYYSKVKKWEHQYKCTFGRYLLYKAMHIFLLDGAQPIFRENVPTYRVPTRST